MNAAESILERLGPAARAAAAVLGASAAPSPGRPGHPGSSEDEALGFLAWTGLGGAFYKALPSGRGGELSPGFRGKVKALYYGAYALNMVRASEFAALVRGLSARGIPVMPLKGIYIAEAVHCDIGQRPMADVDVLVRPEHVDAACGILSGMGYAPAPMPIDAFLGPFGRHAPPMYHPGKKVSFEVHRRLDYPFAFAAAWDPFARAREAEVCGAAVHAPSHEDFLYLWAVHTAYLDAYVGKFRDLYDLAVFVERFGPSVDWARVGRFGFYIARPLRLGLLAAGGIFCSRSCLDAAARLETASRPGFPTERLSRDFMVSNICGGPLARRLPMSALSAASFLIHCPEHAMALAREFLGAFLFPPADVLRRHYGPGLPGWILRLKRPAHVFLIIAQRLARKSGAGW